MENDTRIDDLSLADCEAYDPHPQVTGNRLRFKCSRHGGDRQKSLSVDTATGKFTCHNAGCGIWGTLVEHQGDNPDRPTFREPKLIEARAMKPFKPAVERAVAAWKEFPGSAAQDYARRRRVPDHLSATYRLGYWCGEWSKEASEWLTAPLRCPVTGIPVGIYGRNIHTNDPALKGRILGPKGLFGATKPGPMPPVVALVEGVFDALALLAEPVPYPARATSGTVSARECAAWFDHCEQILLLPDEDRGRDAAEKLLAELARRRRLRDEGPSVMLLQAGVLRQFGCKDLAEMRERKIPIQIAMPPSPPAEPVVPVQDAASTFEPELSPLRQEQPEIEVFEL